MPASLPAVVAAHKGALVAAGALAAVGLGLRSRKAAAKPAASTVAYAGKGGVYDSTANDVYNSIQPQVGALASQLNDLQDQITRSQSPTTTPRASNLGTLALPKGYRYQISSEATSAGASPELKVSLMGRYYDASGYTAVDSVPLAPGQRYYLSRVADVSEGATPGAATIDYADPGGVIRRVQV